MRKMVAPLLAIGVLVACFGFACGLVWLSTAGTMKRGGCGCAPKVTPCSCCKCCGCVDTKAPPLMD